jgi:hypothetical protein
MTNIILIAIARSLPTIGKNQNFEFILLYKVVRVIKGSYGMYEMISLASIYRGASAY